MLTFPASHDRDAPFPTGADSRIAILASRGHEKCRPVPVLNPATEEPIGSISPGGYKPAGSGHEGSAPGFVEYLELAAIFGETTG